MHPSPDVLALLALGEDAATPAEREHVATCVLCRAEVTELSRAVAAGRSGGAADAGLVAPPDRVWTAIRTELGFGPASVELDGAAYGAHGRREISEITAAPRRNRAEANGSDLHHHAPEPVDQDREPDVTRLDEVRSRSSRGRRGLAVLVAAAVALVLGLGLGLGLDRVLGRQTVLWTAELQAEPNFAGSKGEAIVQVDRDGRRTLVIDLSSPEPVDGSRQVWLIDRDLKQTRPLGYLNGDTGKFNIPADVDPRQLPVVDVSKEPPADSDLGHSGTSIVRGTLNV